MLKTRPQVLLVILIGGFLCTNIMHSCAPTESPNGLSQAKDTFQITLDSNQVPLDTAITEVALYQLWQKLLPDSFQIVGDSIYFKPKHLSDTTREQVNVRAHQIHLNPDGVMPYMTKDARVRAYFIHNDDLLSTMGQGKEGIRVYLAAKHYGQDINNIQSHLYIVAADAHQDYFDTIPDGDSIVYDLVAPCPAACDVNSPLNQPVFTSTDD